MPFDVLFDTGFGHAYKENAEQRETPAEYNDQQSSVVIDSIHIPRVFFSLVRRNPLSRVKDFLHVMHNDQYIGSFIMADSKVQIQALILEDVSIQKVKELMNNSNYKIPTQCAIIRYFPKLIANMPGFKSDTAFE
jgi:hypothetical protein